MTEVIKSALEAKLGGQDAAAASREKKLRAIAKECRKARTIDPRSEDEILGYGENGGFFHGGR